MKCFISQNMSNKTEAEIFKRRGQIEAYVHNFVNRHIEFVDSYVKDLPPVGVNIGVWYLGKSIEALSQAKLFVISKEDLSSRGCELEYNIAKAYGIDILIM